MAINNNLTLKLNPTTFSLVSGETLNETNIIERTNNATNLVICLKSLVEEGLINPSSLFTLHFYMLSENKYLDLSTNLTPDNLLIIPIEEKLTRSTGFIEVALEIKDGDTVYRTLPYRFQVKSTVFNNGEGLTVEDIPLAEQLMNELKLSIQEQKINISQMDSLIEEYSSEEFQASLIGPQGEPGIDGINGIDGEKGEKGDKGDKGDAFTYEDFTSVQLTNLTGPQGEKGDIGPIGPQGPPGVDGKDGPEGPQGIQGPPGPKGDKGDKGDVGPQGEKGDKGDTGGIGPQGPAGKDGINGEPGPAGKDGVDGKNGVDGKDGMSAYQSALNGGYTGDEATFYNDLAAIQTLATELGGI